MGQAQSVVGAKDFPLAVSCACIPSTLSAAGCQRCAFCLINWLDKQNKCAAHYFTLEVSFSQEVFSYNKCKIINHKTNYYVSAVFNF